MGQHLLDQSGSGQSWMQALVNNVWNIYG